MRCPGSRCLLVALLAAVTLGFAAPLAAQAPQDTLYHHSSPFYVKYGKFLLLGLAAGMSIKAATHPRQGRRELRRSPEALLQ